MGKKMKRKVKIKVLPILILLFVIIVGVFSYFKITKLPIKNIYIYGNNYIKDQEIIELAGIENYPSFINTKTSTIKKNITKNEYIKDVKVKKEFFGIIKITIEEHNILFRKEETNLIVLDNKKELDDSNKYQVPILLNYIPDTKYDSFIKGMNNVTEDVKYLISEILYDPNEKDDDRFLLYMNDGNSVYLTLTKFKQINYYKDVLKELDGKKGILYLDSGNHFEIKG